MPPTRVDPLLLIPGNNAITWNNPTTKASIIVIFSFSFFPFKSFTRKSINAVISNEIPTNLTEVKLSILLLNNKPTIPAGIVAIREAKADEAVLKMKYYEALATVANGKATKIFIPNNLAGISSIASVAKESLTDIQEKEWHDKVVS